MSKKAVEHLLKVDPAFAPIVAAAGPYAPRDPIGDPFAALLRAIVFQQLAGRAATAIHERVLTTLGNRVPTPNAVAAITVESLRAAGLSGAKTAAILDLAAKCSDGTVPINDLASLEDDEIVQRLCVVRGIGPWTAEMFLLFELRRLDVWPVDDFAVRKGYALLHGMENGLTAKVLAPLGEPFRPYRSVAAWYCWRATDTILP